MSWESLANYSIFMLSLCLVVAMDGLGIKVDAYDPTIDCSVIIKTVIKMKIDIAKFYNI